MNVLLDRMRIIKEILKESKRIREELHDDVTALIHASDMRDLVKVVADESINDKEIILTMCEAGLEHLLYAE